MKEKEKNDQSTEVKTIKRLNGRANEMLKILYLNGATYEEIGKKIGCSRQAVSRYLKELGLKKRPSYKLNDGQIELLKRLFYEGATFEEIAEYLFLTRQSVAKYATRLGLKRARISPKYKAYIDSVKQLLSEGKNKDEIIELTKINELIYADILSHLEEMDVKNSPVTNNIIKLLRLGYEPKEISALLNISVQRIQYWEKKQKNNIINKGEPEQKKTFSPDNVMLMSSRGATIDEMAEYFNCDKNDILMMQNCWVNKEWQAAEENKDKIIDFVNYLHDIGCNIQEISDDTGLTIAAVEYCLQQAKNIQ